jgi:DNA-binding response OmpR family regulator
MRLIWEQAGTTIDLVLTDVIMPHMSGAELAVRLRKTEPNIRIIFMSGYTDNSLEKFGLIEAGETLLVKPFHPSELTLKVKEIMDGMRVRNHV